MHKCMKNKDNKLVQATIISNSNKQPMKESEKSTFTDFIYVGPVTKWVETNDPTQTTPTYKAIKTKRQKKIYYPAPIPY